MPGWIRPVVCLCLLGAARPAPADNRLVDVRVTSIEAPVFSRPRTEWIRISTSHSGTVIAALARPRGNGPLPVVAAMQAAGRPVESHVYRGGVHGGMFVDARQHADELRRIVRFLRHPPR